MFKLVSNPPYRSEGGHPKSLKKHLLELVPEHEIFIEPFFGGGSIFWDKPKAKIEIINDINEVLTTFLKKLKKGECTTKCNMIPNKEKFKKLRDKLKSLNFSFCDFIYVNKHSYAGNMKSFAPSKFCYNDPKCTIHTLDCKKVTERMKNVKIETKDFRDFIKSLPKEIKEDPNVFWFVNPPYYTYTREKGCKWDHGCGLDPQEVYNAIKDIKGKILVTLSNDPHSREVFCKNGKFKCHTFTVTQSASPKKKKGKFTHLIAKNY